MFGYSLPNLTHDEADRRINEMRELVERNCAEHERLALAYRKAIWQPWLRLSIDEPLESDE
jgi:hypothetical protein